MAVKRALRKQRRIVREQLISRYIEGGNAVKKYRQIIEGTPMGQPLSFPHVMSKFGTLELARLTPMQREELQQRVKKSLEIRNKVQRIMHLPKEKLFQMSFGVRLPKESIAGNDAIPKFHSYGIHWNISESITNMLERKGVIRENLEGGRSGVYLASKRTPVPVTVSHPKRGNFALILRELFGTEAERHIRKDSSWHEIEHVHTDKIVSKRENFAMDFLLGELVSTIKGGKSSFGDQYVTITMSSMKLTTKEYLGYKRKAIASQTKNLKNLIKRNGPAALIKSIRDRIEQGKKELEILKDYRVVPEREIDNIRKQLIGICNKNFAAVKKALRFVPKEELANIVAMMPFQKIYARLPALVKQYRENQAA